MATVIGDASIRILLDPTKAKAELDRLGTQVEKVDESRQKATQNASTSLNEIKEKGKQATQEFRKVSQGTGMDFKAIMRVVSLVSSGVVFAAQKGLPAIGASIRESTKGIPGIESLGAKIDEELKLLSSKIVETEKNIKATLPTFFEAVQFGVASLKLGNKRPSVSDSVDLWFNLHSINSKKAEFESFIDRGMMDFLIQRFGSMSRMQGQK